MITPRFFLSALLLGTALVSFGVSPASGQRPKKDHARKDAIATTSVITSDTSTPSSAATVPVGFMQQAIAPATDASTPVSTVISVPFYNAASYAGLVTSVDSASTLSSSAATWTASQFSSTSSPYFVHFKSGNSVGRYFLITANTATQLTVANRGYDLTAVSAAADSFEILPAFTLGTLFDISKNPFQTGASAAVADNVLLWNGSTWDTYYHNGTNWKKAGNLAIQDTTILYPDEGMFIIRRGTTPLSLTFLGTVPSTAERSDVTGPGSTFVANRFPVDTTLVNVGFQNLPNWLSGSSAVQADNVYIWDGSKWGVFYYNSANWKKAGNLGILDTQPIPAGTAMFVVRQSTATGTNATLAQILPYSLN